MAEFCLIKYTVSTYQIDGSDLDRDPDKLPVNGRIVFEPLMDKGDSVVVTENGVSETISLTPIEARVTNSELYHRGEPGIKLFAGGATSNPERIRYRANFHNMVSGTKSITMKPVIFEAVPGGELALSLAQPVPRQPYPGIGADQAVVNSANEAADRAWEAVATIDTADQIKSWASEASESADTASTAASDALVIKNSIPATVQSEVDTRVPPKVAEVIAADSTVVDAAEMAVGDAVDGLDLMERTAAESLIEAGRWEKTSWLDGTVPVTSLASGLHQVRSVSVANTLGLPTATSGSLWVHQIGTGMGHMQWMPTSRDETYTQRLHGESWTGWRLDDYVSTASLTPSDVVEDLQTGLYQVTSASTAETLGLPVRSSGSLWVHRIGSALGRMEFRAAANNDVWQRRLASSTAGWQPWTQDTGGMEPHNHDDRYYTKSQVDSLVGDTSDGEITGVSLTLEDTGHAFIPTEVGVDGALYGHTTGMTRPVRSFDGVNSEPEQGPRFPDFTTGNGIVHVERTSEGFVVIWRVDSLAHEVWFSPEWDGPYVKVLDIGPWLFTAKVRSRLVAGTSWMMIAEYTNAHIPSWPLKRFLSTDGGETWTMIRETIADNAGVNSHHHTGLIRADGRIYTSEGDGVLNNWFGYSDDRGKTWIPIPIDPTVKNDVDNIQYSQPTTIIDFGDNIATSPDTGVYQPGMWSMDPYTHRQEIVWELAHGGPYSDASKQYGRSQYAQDRPEGKEAYALFPPAGSGNRDTYVAATPDGGKRWGVVATIPLGDSGILNTGVFGPDLHGNIYMRGGSLPTFGSNVIRAKTIDWRKLDY